MKIGIIGTGRMASALAARWARAGHDIFMGSRDAERGREAGAALGAQGGTYAQAAAHGEILLLATPWNATRDVLAGLGDLGGKPLIETTNNFGGAGDGDGATTEQVAAWAVNARVVKAFNTVFSPILTSDLTDRPTVFMVGDDDAAKRQVGQLISDAGFDPVDAGGAANARWLDALAQLIVHLGYQRGMGSGIAYKLIQARQS